MDAVNGTVIYMLEEAYAGRYCHKSRKADVAMHLSKAHEVTGRRTNGFARDWDGETKLTY